MNPNLNAIPDPWKPAATPYVPLLAQAFANQGIAHQRVMAYAAVTVSCESSWNPSAINTTDAAANTGYPGMGLAQITWKTNYEAVSRVTGIDFVNHPRFMLEPLKSLIALAAFLKINNLVSLIESGDYRTAAGKYNGSGPNGDYAIRVAAQVPSWLGVFVETPIPDHGADPIQMNCAADAYTVAGGTADIKDEHGQLIGKVELRYSPSCQCNWTKVTSLIGAASLSGAVLREDGVKCVAQFNNTASMYTDMVFAPSKKAQAIGSINGHSAQTPSI